MTEQLISFASAVLLGLIAFFWVFRGLFRTLVNSSEEHAKSYTSAYVKCFCLIALAAGTTFKEVFQPITVEQAARFAWWDWIIKFSAPVLSGLSVLSAFLDRSLQRVDEDKARRSGNTNPPIQTQ